MPPGVVALGSSGSPGRVRSKLNDIFNTTNSGILNKLLGINVNLLCEMSTSIKLKMLEYNTRMIKPLIDDSTTYDSHFQGTSSRASSDN